MRTTQQSRQRRGRWIAVSTAILLCWLTGAVGAVSGREEPSKESTGAAGGSPTGAIVTGSEGQNNGTAGGEEMDDSASGLRAIRDPETGRFVTSPTEAQRRMLALRPRAALARSVAGLRPFRLERGGRGIHLQGRFHSALVVRVAEDGSLHTTCGEPAHDGVVHDHEGGAGGAHDREAAGPSDATLPVEK